LGGTGGAIFGLECVITGGGLIFSDVVDREYGRTFSIGDVGDFFTSGNNGPCGKEKSNYGN